MELVAGNGSARSPVTHVRYALRHDYRQRSRLFDFGKKVRGREGLFFCMGGVQRCDNYLFDFRARKSIRYARELFDIEII